MNYKEYKSNLAFDFTPADGGKLTENNVKVYFSDKNAITFEGAKFTYQDENDKNHQTIVKEGITSTPDGEEAIEYTIPITDAIKNGKNVRFTLTGVVANDGLDHSDITAKWNPGQELVATLAPSNLSVKDGSYVKSYNKHQLTFDEDVTINENIEAGATYKDIKSGKIINANVEPVANSSRQIMIIPTEDLKDKHQYELTIKERVIVNKEYAETNGKYGKYMTEQSYGFTIYANVDTYDFVTSPVEGSSVNEISTIICSMKPGADEGTSAIGYANPTDKFVYLLNEKNEKVATATCGDIEGGMYIKFSPAITEPGTYTVHIDDYVYFVGTGFNAAQNENPVEFKYTVVAAPEELQFTTDPENESTITSLGEIVIMSDKDIYGTTTPIQAYCDRQVFNGTLTMGDVNRREAYIEFTDAAGEPITAEGEYRIEIPAGVFGNKAWYDSECLSGACNAATTLYYTVGKEATEITYTADPANGSKVDALGTVTIDNNTTSIMASSGQIVIYKDVKELKKVEAEVVYKDPNDFNEVSHKATVAVNATEKGVYTIEIPEGYFVDENGDNIPAVTLTYYVGVASGIQNINAAIANGTVYNLNGVKVNKATNGIFIVNGKKVAKK